MRFLLIIASFFFTCSLFAQNTVLATVGSKTITLEEFNRKFNEVKAQASNPPTKEQFLEDLIRYSIGLQEAEKRNLQKDPVVLDRMNQEIYKALLEKELGEKVQKITVNDKDMEDFYKNNPEIRFSHIMIEVKVGATSEQRAEAKRRAEEIWQEVKGSKRPFEELVRLYTDDPISKQTGGDVGWQNRVTVMPSVYETLLKMKEGEIRGLVDTRFGFHIIKLSGKRTFKDADKRTLRAAVFDEKRKVIFNQFFDSLKKGYSIKENRGLLKN
jgi:parvulin-like peptidyl-prolyl isomerase